jgi:hypothetical protein
MLRMGYFRQPEIDKLDLRDGSSPLSWPSIGGKFWRTFTWSPCGPLVSLGLGMPGEDMAAAHDSMTETEDDMQTSKGQQQDRVVIPPASAMEADMSRRPSRLMENSRPDEVAYCQNRPGSIASRERLPTSSRNRRPCK